MIETLVRRIKEVHLQSPVMVEGLPGVGHVGKLVAEHLIDELSAELIMEIYSPHFPPQVLVRKDGTVRQVRNEIYAYQGHGKTPDLLILVGDYQSATNEGHYELTGIFLDLAEEMGVSRIYTLGGFGTGQFVEPQVLGATNRPDLVEQMKQNGVLFHEEEPGGGIIGVSGLLLGLGGLRDIEAVCLMGTTSGYLVDPKSAHAVLKVLSQALQIEVGMQALEDRAKEMERIVGKLQEMERAQMPYEGGGEEDLRYIG
ncbi:MAG: PAC2 family protein [Methanosaeta sp. PtaB.Bin039]|nr:MAG: PAC2 family protein [Methanosaeta sp. PtaB.Bin039]OPY44111.1 MAG: PAC2 family protein [Methanosaeta sp. PtaU1.Bin028]